MPPFFQNLSFSLFYLNCKKNGMYYWLPLIFIWSTYPLEQMVRCLEVLDGDSAIVSQNKKVFEIRLVRIDAPERTQKSKSGRAIGEEATNKLKSLCEKKDLRLKTFGKGYYGRTLGELFLGEISLNLQMVKEGFALVYPRAMFKSKRQHLNYLLQMIQAREYRRGIWSSGAFKYPWAYRKSRHMMQPRPRSSKAITLIAK